MLGLALLSTLLSFGAGCSSNAHITLQRSCPLEAHIVSSDRDFIYVEREFSATPAAIPREEIIEIDHPGNGMGVTGLVILGVYGLQAVLGTALFLSDDDDFNQQLGLIYMVNGGIGSTIGAVLAVWGYSIWSRSVEAAMPADTSLTKGSSQLVPWLGVDATGGMVRGVGLQWTY